jgi:hypothetical protein
MIIHEGQCHICGNLIPYDEQRAKRVFNFKTKKPVFGWQRIIPLPAYPCGHVFYWTQDCYKTEDGMFEYR